MKMNSTHALLALALVAGSTAVLAQATASPQPQQMRAKIAERFATADVNHDGKLTRAEAESGMPMVAKNFDQIDKSHKGYVTLDDIKAYSQARMADRQATKSGSAPATN